MMYGYAAFILLFWLDTMCAVIHTNIVKVGLGNSEIIITLLGFLLPPGGIFDPRGDTTRAEAAAMLQRFTEKNK